MRIQAEVAAGQSVIVQEAYDPNWRAESAGARLAIRKDALGQMLIETPPGWHNIRLVFETPLENRVGQAITLISLATVIGLAIAGRRRSAV